MRSSRQLLFASAITHYKQEVIVKALSNINTSMFADQKLQKTNESSNDNCINKINK